MRLKMRFSIAEKLRQSIEEPFAVENCIVAVSASIGVAVCPGDGVDEQTLQVKCRPRDVSGQKPWRQCRRAQ
jgi:GGDEF domain-containing protein